MQDLGGRFWKKVNKLDDGGCWLWTAGKDGKGYGNIKIKGITCVAARVAYMLVHGKPLSKQVQLRHICLNKTCVNPSHMRVTPTTRKYRSYSIWF